MRYPSEPWIGATVAAYKEIDLALHICGSAARVKFKSGYYDPWMKYVKRIQINGVVEINELVAICNTYSGHTIITQHSDRNADLIDVVLNYNNHSLLVDGSGGRGISPEKWKAPVTNKNVGFAGGMGPGEIAKNLVDIVPIAKNGFWIDMENKLRTNDKFDIEKIQQVIREVDSFNYSF